MVRKSEINNLLAILLFTMLCFGYIISSFIPAYFTLASRPFNLGSRVVYLLISLYLIYANRFEVLKKGMSNGFWLLAGFLIIYSFRILIDIFVFDIVFKGSIFFTLTFSIGGSFIPFFALALSVRKIDFSKLLTFSYWILWLSSLLLLVLVYKIYGGFNIEMLARRLSFLSHDEKAEVINPITLSFYGMCMSLLSLFFMFFKRKMKVLWLFLSLIVGFVLLLLGASRGPQITFAIGALFLLFAYLFKTKKRMIQKVKVGFWMTLIIAGILRLLSIVDLTQVGMYNRFAKLGQDASSDTSLREESWLRAWQYFLDSPIVGKAYIDTASNSYPHNIYLEALMATGIIGGVLFFLSLLIFLTRKMDNINKVGVFLIFIISTLSSLFSGSLFINPLLWCILGLMSQYKYIEGQSLKISVNA